MSNITEISQFDADVLQLQTTDFVLGGPTGISNTQAQQLANRTRFLYDYRGVINKYANVISYAANISFDHVQEGVFVILDATAGSLTATLPTASFYTKGQRLQLATICAYGNAITIASVSGFRMGGQTPNVIYLHDAEHLVLVANGTYYEVESISDSFLEVGDCLSGYVARTNTLVRRGQILNRSAFPRLWAWCVANLTDGGNLIDDSTWNSNIQSQGFFSKGNGITTFRLPDDRGMFDRYADGSRGLDVDRASNFTGSGQAMDVQKHSHIFPGDDQLTNADNGTPSSPWKSRNAGTFNKDWSGDGDGAAKYWLTSDGNGLETRPMNISKLPLIKI